LGVCFDCDGLGVALARATESKNKPMPRNRTPRSAQFDLKLKKRYTGFYQRPLIAKVTHQIDMASGVI
jgi:hypothetical protein